jgi:hypothetical protein
MSLIFEYSRRVEKPRFVFESSPSKVIFPSDCTIPVGHCYVFYDTSLKMTFVICRIDITYIFVMIYPKQMSRQDENILFQTLQPLIACVGSLDGFQILETARESYKDSLVK